MKVANLWVLRTFTWVRQVVIYGGDSGGEGGIRTLGTCVSPYNGLAIAHQFAMHNFLRRLQSESGLLFDFIALIRRKMFSSLFSNLDPRLAGTHLDPFQ